MAPAPVPTIDVPQIAVAPTAGNDYADVRATPASFGGYIGQAMSGLGQSLEQQGTQLNATAQFSDNLENENQASNAMVSATSQMGDLATKLYSLRGQAAVDAGKTYPAQVAGIYDAVNKGLPSPAAQALFGRAMGFRMSMAYTSAARFTASQQLAVSKDTQAAAGAQNSLDAVNNRNDPTASAAFIAAGAHNAANLVAANGGNPQMQLIAGEQYVGKAMVPLVESLVQEGQVAEAQFRFDSVRASMDPQSQARIEAYLQPRVAQAKAQWIVNSITHKGPLQVPSTTPIADLSNAVMTQESGGQQFGANGAPLTSAKGAVGLMQIEPGALADVNQELGTHYTMQDMQTNPTVNKAVGTAYLSMMVRQFHEPTLALAAYNAGPQAVKSALEQYGNPAEGALSYQDFLSHLPPETQQYVAAISANLNRSAGFGTSDVPPSTPIDPGSVLQAVAARVQNEPPDVQRAAMSQAAIYVREQQALGGQARATTVAHIKQTAAALWAGQPATVDPVEIGANLPPAEAAQAQLELKVAQVGGQVLKPMALATPAEIGALESDLNPAGPGGPMTAELRKAAGITIGPDGKVPLAEAGTDFTVRQHVVHMLGMLLHQRAAALKTDPASYVLGADPNVSADYQKAVLSNSPADWGAYAVSAQHQLGAMGVAPGQQFILPAQEAQKLTGGLLNADPVTAAQTLAGAAKQFGAAWPAVFGQLVVQQHLPGDLRVIPTMTAPGQAAIQADLVNANQVMHGKGGLTTWLKTALPAGASGQIEKALSADPLLAQFRGTVMPKGGLPQPALLETMEGAVSRLAMFYMAQSGATPVNAVTRAAQGIIGLRYSMDGTMRVPAGTLPQVNSQIATMENGLTAKGLDANRYAPAQADIVAKAAKDWITNSTDDGLVMAYRGDGGHLRRVWGANGQPIGFKFSDMGPAVPLTAASMPDAPTAGIGL